VTEHENAMEIAEAIRGASERVEAQLARIAGALEAIARQDDAFYNATHRMPYRTALGEQKRD
jgi:hypothetical protein